MVTKKNRWHEVVDGECWDPQEKLDELTGDESLDAEAFHEGRYAKSAQDAYEATERRHEREPSATQRRHAANTLMRRVIAKAAQA